jgi:Cu2+-exporting ATPase
MGLDKIKSGRQQYDITGMSCAACSTRVENVVRKVEGVTECAVNLLTNSMGVEGDVQPETVIAAVEKAGYGASLRQENVAFGEGAGRGVSGSVPTGEDYLKDKETPLLLRRLLASVGFLLVLMYFSMGHMMWGWRIPAWFQGNCVGQGLLQLLLTTAIMVINQKFFVNGFKGLLHGAPNMDTLVALGSTAAYAWSTYVLFCMTAAVAHGDEALAMAYMDDLYYESAAMILTLITVGKMLEAHSKGKTTDALKSLMSLAPRSAVVERDGAEVSMPVEQVSVGDVFLVRPGESIPVDKAAGDRVSAATINQSGFIRCRATGVGEDTTLSQIIRMVSDAAATKAPIAKVADKVSGVFVPTVMAIALVTVLVWLLCGAGFGFALARGISVLVISCPCALGLATPVAIMVGNGLGARNGILFKNAVTLEQTGKVNIVALDKTGTITSGQPVVTDVVPCVGHTEKELVSFAHALELRSEHPLARAVVDYAAKLGGEAAPCGVVQDFRALPGNGVVGSLDGARLVGGSLAYVRDMVNVSGDMADAANAIAADGRTPLLFARGDELLGIIGVADTVRSDSPQAIRELREMGIRVVMITGDNERTANAIGRQAGVDEVVAGVLPDGKENVIRGLMEQGKVAMVGDGINDAPALTRADVGIAIGAGTDVAIDAADVVLMKSRLSDVPAAIRLSRGTLRNIHENLFWAFFYNVLGIPLAAGVWIPLFGWKLNPMFAAAAMSLSSFCVVTNALRLNLLKIHAPGSIDEADRANEASVINEANIINEDDEKENVMEKTIRIEGMMCMHCENHVKTALEAIEGVTEARVSHEAGTAVVTLGTPVEDESLVQAVVGQGYKVLGVE